MPRYGPDGSGASFARLSYNTPKALRGDLGYRHASAGEHLRPLGESATYGSLRPENRRSRLRPSTTTKKEEKKKKKCDDAAVSTLHFYNYVGDPGDQIWYGEGSPLFISYLYPYGGVMAAWLLVPLGYREESTQSLNC